MVSAPSDEFRFLSTLAVERGLRPSVLPVERRALATRGGDLSVLQWGEAAPTFVFLHGLGQNAHTFDTVALMLAASLVSVDLPGHGWSDAATDAMTSLETIADVLSDGLEPLLTSPAVLVGMSLGGLCAIALAQRQPTWWSHLVLLDITPGARSEKARGVLDFLDGPDSFDSHEDMVARALAHNPTRSRESLERGVALNARQREDGKWVWHHQVHTSRLRPQFDAAQLWLTLHDLPLPVSLLHGTRSDSMVDSDDRRAFAEERPTDVVVAIEGAGHALQSESPEAVASYLDSVRPSAALRERPEGENA